MIRHTIAVLTAAALMAAADLARADSLPSIADVSRAQDLALIQGAALTASEPTNAVGPTVDVPTFFTDVWGTLMGQGLTNLSVTVYGTYTPSISAWGSGVVVTRNLPLGETGLGTGIGVGLDWYDSDLYAVNGQVSLNANMLPFKTWGKWGANVVMTPFTYIGLGTPISGTKHNGDLETIVAVGSMFRVAKLLGAYAEVGGVYGTRTGLGNASGTFYGPLFDLTWKF